MKTKSVLVLFNIFIVSLVFLSCTQQPTGPNTLNRAEVKDGWILMFDGETNEGWRRYNDSYFPTGWVIEEGTLHCKSSGRGEAGAHEGGDIIFDKKFSNFHFMFDWKISEAGNSGVLYLGQEIPDHPYMWKNAPEYQVLDNENHGDAKLGKNGNRKSGSLYDLIPADPQTAKPFGEWNVGEIIVKDGIVSHRLNGETVLEYELWSAELDDVIAGSKWPGENENWRDIAKEGLIGLQDHGDDVWYRNIKIKEL